MSSHNKVWAEKIINKFDPSFQHRWVVYEDLLFSLLSQNKIWIDIGCGENLLVNKYFSSTKFAIGLDLIKPNVASISPFVCSDLYNLPFRSESVDLITLRFVVEHLNDVQKSFTEIVRILKPGGKILILTTNVWSPFIFVPILFPFCLKKIILKKIYKVEGYKIFKTYHEFNSLKKFRIKRENLKLTHLNFIQDANYVRKWVFVIFFLWHLISKPKYLSIFRTNIIAVYQKQDLSQSNEE